MVFTNNIKDYLSLLMEETEYLPYQKIYLYGKMGKQISEKHKKLKLYMGERRFSDSINIKANIKQFPVV